MSSNRLRRLFLVAGFVSASAAAQIQCPRTLNSHGKHQTLQDASVFDGPPEELAELMPDLENSEWDIVEDQMAARERKQSLYLVCRYNRTKEAVQLLIPPDATLCKIEGAADGGIIAWCKVQLRKPTKASAKGIHGHQS